MGSEQIGRPHSGDSGALHECAGEASQGLSHAKDGQIDKSVTGELDLEKKYVSLHFLCSTVCFFFGVCVCWGEGLLLISLLSDRDSNS